MATRLTKSVVRECVRARYGKRPLVASLEPETEGECERIVIREKGRRHAFGLPISTVYLLAAREAADAAKRVTARGGRRRVNRGILGGSR